MCSRGILESRDSGNMGIPKDIESLVKVMGPGNKTGSEYNGHSGNNRVLAT